MTMVTAVASLLAVCLVEPAFAGERPCADDVARHCRDVAPGAGRVLRCLHAHRDQLSAGCRAANDTRIGALARRHPCVEDRERFCAGVPSGQGKIVACLRSHVDDLSPSCRQAIAARAGEPTR